MISFFRKIRKKLADDNKPMKYMRYAVGEIALVVIGILIALQINNWNEGRLKETKEIDYLIEIQQNLYRDTIRINETLKFNGLKRDAILNTIKTFEKASEGNYNLDEFANQMALITSFEVFLPFRTAFDNLVEVEKIDLITNLNLRLMLSGYYNKKYENGTEESIKMRTRSIVESASIHLMTKEFIQQLSGVLLSIKSKKDTKIFEDEILLINMVNMLMTMQYYDNELRNIKQEVYQIIQTITLELKEDQY